ncbi:general negative regulator of transcription subunit 1-like isoform X1 [Magnolia sinica]|uniref:general negative regulator of transcription subunit 1-like isoform X1 n=1 Tax=Magnolia sinica TaxID=86752 RepID=UPI00265B5B3E|nr:general negative regulator of transcription subunit 1-like isoform X1 [Magnolia sinica]
MQEPASEIQDKILFMINNISTSNMDVKAKEFTDVLKEQYYPWFAQYMVMKRHGRMRSSQSFYKGPSSAWNAVLPSGTSNNRQALDLFGNLIHDDRRLRPVLGYFALV